MEKTNEEQIKIDKLYEKDLSFSEIMGNPILQPVAEASAIYESYGLVIQRALAEYERTKEQIAKMLEENPTYNQTIIMSKIRAILEYSQQIIHSQDIQRESLKRCLSDVIKITSLNYEPKEVYEKSKPIDGGLETRGMGQFIKEEINSNSVFGERDLQEIEEQKEEKKKKKTKEELAVDNSEPIPQKNILVEKNFAEENRFELPEQKIEELDIGKPKRGRPKTIKQDKT